MALNCQFSSTVSVSLLEMGTFTEEWRLQHRRFRHDVHGEGSIEWVVIEKYDIDVDYHDDVKYLLEAASKMTSLPLDIIELNRQPVLVNFRNFTELDLKKLDHLLQMLTDGGIEIEFQFVRCNDMNRPSMKPFFRFLPLSKAFLFNNSPLEKQTMRDIAIGLRSSRQKSPVKSINFGYCGVDDEMLEYLLPSLPHIPEVVLHGNPSITLKSFKALKRIIMEMEGEISMDIIVASDILKGVRKLFKKFTGIQVRIANEHYFLVR